MTIATAFTDVEHAVENAAKDPAGFFLSLGEAAIKQIHAGAKFSGKAEFDAPGPFDPVVDYIVEVRFDDGRFRIKQFHITPSIG